MTSRLSLFRLLGILAVAGWLAGCATTGNSGDPLEGYNRAMHSFNEKADKYALKPAAQAYDTVVPEPAQMYIGNVFSNVGDVWIGVNNLLQGKPGAAWSDTMRILVNTFFGFAGTLDIATPMGFEKHDEDFGQTLAVWGVGEGAYVVLPFLGPSTVRDALALPLDSYGGGLWSISHSPTRYTVMGTKVLNTRARLLGAEKTLQEATLDSYGFVRDFYLQQRRFKVNDGQVQFDYGDFDEPY